MKNLCFSKSKFSIRKNLKGKITNDKILITAILCINLFANQLELAGTVISDNEKMITSRNMGYIKEVFFVKKGFKCKKGDILYEIDSSNMDSNKKSSIKPWNFTEKSKKILN